MFEIAKMMKQAKDMQKKMEEVQKTLGEKTVEGSAGAGGVTLGLSGHGEMRFIKIDKSLVQPEAVEDLEDMIMAAHHDAKRKMDELAGSETEKATGGFSLPKGLKLPF